MQLPAMLQGDSLTRILQGAAFGAIATMLIGFNWGGWMLDSTAVKKIEDGSRSAVVAVLAPICVDKFRRDAAAPVNLVELKKVVSYQQGSFVEKGGWATLPGSEKANSAVAQACANILGSVK